MMKSVKKSQKLTSRRNFNGYYFILPWLIGVTVFFVYPFIQSIWFAFCDLSFSSEGLVKEFVGLKNFKIVFFESPQVFQKIQSAIGSTLTELVLIITISFFLAIILNQNFKGKTFARAIFSLPLIVSSGVLLSIIKGSIFSQTQSSIQESSIFQATGIATLLEDSGIASNLTETVITYVNQFVDMLWKSGIQIIVFLVGIQSISPSFYEVCDIEGATAWQKFWSVTFPIMMPYCFLNVIYTIIDSFTYYQNPVMSQIMIYFKNIQYSLSNTLALAYFVVISIIAGVIAKLMSSKMVYIDK